MTGRWLMAAVPGLGVRSVFVPDEAPADPSRALADEIQQGQFAVLELSLRASGDGLYEERPRPLAGPDARSPGAGFLANFGGRG